MTATAAQARIVVVVPKITSVTSRIAPVIATARKPRPMMAIRCRL